MPAVSGIDKPATQISAAEVGPVSSKPPRMRTACTECHAAKVRCSGERTGCTRCRQNNFSCIYKLSMVGRTSKRRRDGASNSSTNTGGNTNSNSSVDGRQPRSPSPGGGRSLSSPTPTGGLLPSVMPEMPALETSKIVSPSSLFVSTSTETTRSDFSTGGSLDFADDSFGWSWELPDSGSIHHHGPADSGPMSALLHPMSDKPQYLSPSSSASTATTDPSLPAFSSLSYSGSGSGGVSSGGSCDGTNDEESRERTAQLVALCRMTSSLETHLQSKSGSLDQIMKVNKACLAEVVKLTARMKQRGQQARRCSFIMIMTCLDIMLSLFEDVVRSSGLDPRSLGSGSGSSGGRWPESSSSRMPSLHFGVFELDPQEQLVITRRIVARELHNYRDVVRGLSTEFQDTSADFFRKMAGQWCQALIARLGQLPIPLDKAVNSSESSSPYGASMFI